MERDKEVVKEFSKLEGYIQFSICETSANFGKACLQNKRFYPIFLLVHNILILPVILYS